MNEEYIDFTREELIKLVGNLYERLEELEDENEKLESDNEQLKLDIIDLMKYAPKTTPDEYIEAAIDAVAFKNENR